MRKITEESRHAFLRAERFRKGNMAVEIRPWQDQKHDSVILLLHGNPIARYDMGDVALATLQVCDGGWQTVTTRDRLNSLPGVDVTQRKFKWFLNGAEWDGFWAYVTPAVTVKAFFEAKGRRSWWVELPGLPTATFTREEAAMAYAKVECSNTGLPLRVAA